MILSKVKIGFNIINEGFSSMLNILITVLLMSNNIVTLLILILIVYNFDIFSIN